MENEENDKFFEWLSSKEGEKAMHECIRKTKNVQDALFEILKVQTGKHKELSNVK